MKISFNRVREDYIGDYFSEYLLRRIGKRKSFAEIIEERASDKEDTKEVDKTSFLINYKETSIYRHINEVIKSDSEFFKMLNKGQLKRVSREEFEKIQSIGIRYLNTDKYTFDFALLVIYARLMCFQDRKKSLRDVYMLLHSEDRKDIIDFFSLVAKGKVDILNIILNYDVSVESRGKNIQEKAKLKIDSPVLMKMMLYEFSKKYFNVFEKIDIEATETHTVEIDGAKVERECNYPIECMIDDLNKNTIQVETFASSKIDFDTTRVAELLELYFKFIIDINILKGKEQKFKIYGLIGNLLVMAGYKSYDEHKKDCLENGYKDNYKYENNYYYKKLVKLWKA